MKKYLFALFLCWMLSNTAFAKNLDYPISGDMQLQLTALESPSPLVANNKTYLVYEFYLTNFMNVPIRVLNLNITGQYGPTPASKVTFDFKGAELSSMFHFVGLPKIQPAADVVDPGIQKIAFVMLPFAAPYQVPDTLVHHLTVQYVTPGATPVVMTAAPLKIKQAPPIIIGAPLEGKNWYIGDGPSNTSLHRSTYRVADETAYFAQRYALDIVKLDAEGHSYAGDAAKNESYHCYKQKIFSVADGQVVAVKDGIPDNIPNSGKLAVPLTLDTVGGNHIVVNIGYHQYAFYAHLVPGSVKVKVGDIVKKGQLLGLLGNSGNSTEPHLHFHVVDNPSFLGANGVPYGFESFVLQPSKVADMDFPIKVKLLNAPNIPMHNQLVLDGAVMEFPAITMTK